MSNNQSVRMLKQRCPCCREQGYLELIACNECNKTIAICELVGTVFTDPLNISMNKVFSDDPKKM
jgi:hypothetical protein